MKTIELDLSIGGEPEAPNKFIKRPKPGHKVKVYHQDRTQSYGFVKKVEKDRARKRERLVLIKTTQVFNISECDFALQEINVRYDILL